MQFWGVLNGAQVNVVPAWITQFMDVKLEQEVLGEFSHFGKSLEKEHTALKQQPLYKLRYTCSK